jgi:hypothetical protein
MLSVTKRISARPVPVVEVPLNRVEAAVYTNSKESQPLPSQSALYTTDGKIHAKPNGLGIEGNV